MSIITRARLEGYLDVTGLDDSKVQVIVDSINTALLRQMRRPSLKVDRAEYPRVGRITSALYIGWPRISIATVKEDYAGGYGQIADTFGDDTELEQGVDYVFDPNDSKGPLLRMHLAWCQVPGGVQVDYVWGWTTPPNDMLHAGLRLAAIAWDSRFREGGGLASERFGDYAYELLSGSTGSGNAETDSDLISVRRTINAYAIEVT